MARNQKKVLHLKSTNVPSSPLQKIRSIHAKITEEILIDDTSESEDDNDLSISGQGKIPTGSSIVKVPFQLFNPKNKDYNVMKVAPLQYGELAPNFEGLNLQIHEALQRSLFQKQSGIFTSGGNGSSSMTGNGNENQLLPQICQTMSLATLPHQQNDIIDLCDSD